MKKFFFFSLLTLFSAGAVCAVQFVQREEFVSGSTETLRDEMWISSTRAEISGTADDDLFILSSVLDLRGTFNGAVWGGGEQIIASGQFMHPLRLAGRLVTIDAEVNRSLTAAGTTVKIEPSAAVAKSALCAGENIISEGTVGGDLRILAHRATVGGKIAGDVLITAQDIAVLPGTVIGGNLIYTAPQELVLHSSVQLAGELKRTFAPPAPKITPGIFSHAIFFFGALLAGVLFCSVFPQYAVTAVQLLRVSRGVCMLVGIVSLIGIPFFIAALMMTLIGLPLGILLSAFYGVLFYLSRIVFALFIGLLLLRRNEISRRTVIGALAAGLAIIYALTAFTAVAMFAHIIVAIFGFGALVLALFKKPVLIIQQPQETKPVTSEE